MAKTKKATTKKKAKIETVAGQAPKTDSALERTIAQIEKQYGSGAIMKMDDSVRTQIDGIQTGALSLDLALGDSASPEDAWLNSTDQSLQEKRRWHSTR